MQYVALLRGINVGGKSIVGMARLKVLFEELGHTSVKTYINSGNVLFSSTLKNVEITHDIEKAIEKTFGFRVFVLIVEAGSIHDIIKSVPKTWTNDSEYKTDVLFLWKSIDSKDVLKKISIKPTIDTVQYISGAVVWHVKRTDVTRSGLLKIVGTPLYKQVTIRNINTVRKLATLLKEDV